MLLVVVVGFGILLRCCLLWVGLLIVLVRLLVVFECGVVYYFVVGMVCLACSLVVWLI